ncbi:hypothetical protein OPV22_026667 [Ensete ventricosum]|uniref:Uncharacterized protein n=1 Tax=Ensete ventricosum TaxID=4639 RepID=A0AAV8PQ79_ENSVE|nr:hypothetical protein OPV22_026667 [Ensete ventricosum]
MVLRPLPTSSGFGQDRRCSCRSASISQSVSGFASRRQDQRVRSYKVVMMIKLDAGSDFMVPETCDCFHSECSLLHAQF